MYFSARSPYSYLGLEQAGKLCEHYRVPLQIKPVLPMMMRGMNVPQNKKMYIFHDTKREANKLGIAYGKVADPLGKAVENCYALFGYAKSQGRDFQYLLEFGRAVNSQGVHADSESGMRLIVERSGLDWQQAKKHLAESHWRIKVEQNMLELNQLGLWGVPCFQYDDTVVWGQDRLWRIEQAICQ
jgi:2-hydroxychromene-2-carboxylate isomerase